jgi:methyl halide transferase
MTSIQLSNEYWNNRYAESDTGWDLGAPSTPLKEYVDQLTDKSIRILIPGCGNAWEAEYLWQQGFTNTCVIDYAPLAIEQFKKRFPDFPEAQVFCGDFFKHEGQYDLIVEQTFFCAIDPSLRDAYVTQMHALLKPSGKLVGLLFNDVLNTDKPPFGGSEQAYYKQFEPKFTFKHWATAYNSIAPRAGREWFIHISPK